MLHVMRKWSCISFVYLHTAGEDERRMRRTTTRSTLLALGRRSIRYFVQKDPRLWKEGTTPVFEQKNEEERAMGMEPRLEMTALSI